MQNAEIRSKSLNSIGYPAPRRWRVAFAHLDAPLVMDCPVLYRDQDTRQQKERQ